MDKWQKAAADLARMKAEQQTPKRLSTLEFIMGGAFRDMAEWEPRDEESKQRPKGNPDAKGKGRV
jgi:hypothetical protein